MTVGFLNLAILAGMAALAIPPIIHFLNRRRHEVIDWGAMQFLQVSPTRKRRLLIEELLLMALRMGMIALLVAAFAAPYVSGPLIASWTRTPRDIALVLDVSASMGLRQGDASTPWQQARDWIGRWLDGLSPGDRVAVCLAGRPPRLLVAELAADQAWVREQLETLDEPVGGADGPRAVHEAWKMLHSEGQTAPRQIVIVSDRQRQGWCDPASLAQWQQLARQIQTPAETESEVSEKRAPPALHLVQLGDAKALATAPNCRLAPLRAARNVVAVGQKLRLHSAVHFDNAPPESRPVKVRLEIGGRPAQQLALGAGTDLKTRQASVTFEHRFTTAGPHLVSAILEADAEDDALPGDNRQRLVIEAVHTLPILLIDGALGQDAVPVPGESADSATYYLAKAFADPTDKASVSLVAARRTTAAAFDADALLLRASPRPRVAVLADVPRLSEAQRTGVERFVREGGGLLFVLGPRVDAKHYNDTLWRGGDGLLPVRLDRVVEAKPGAAVALDVRRFVHPALQLFRDEPQCSLGQAEYTRWWRVVLEADSDAAVGALLTNADPWLAEKSFGKGRVMVSALPMDRSWGGHLPKTWEFPVLVHELIYALADAGSSLPVVVPDDPLESDLTPRSDDDLKKLTEIVPLRVLDAEDPAAEGDGAAAAQEVWWLLLAGVVGLLCGELWLTRRMALARGRS